MPNFRSGLGKDAPAITFRTSPPPPPSRSIPTSFAPPRSPAFPPPSFPAAPPAAPAPAAPAPVPVDDRKIELGLAAILRGLPSSLLAGEASSVPDDVNVTLPFALIEPQLSQGRIIVPRETFLQAMPEAHRPLLSGDGDASDIPLPLQEVFQKLPANALSLRADQVAAETGTYYPTPFSQKADEDAQRFADSATVLSPAAPVKPPAPDAPAAPVTPPEPLRNEVAPPKPGLANADAAETATDVSFDTIRASASPGDVALLAEPVADDPRRDVPLDLAGEAAPVVLPDALSVPGEPAAKISVEARETTPAKDVHPDEHPVADASASLPEIVTPEPVAAAVEPALPPVDLSPVSLHTADLRPPQPAIAETPTAAPEPVSAPNLDHALPSVPVVKEKEVRVAPVRPAPADEGVLQALFMTEDEMDAKGLVKLVCQMPGVNGCAVMFEDGLRLAGNFPDGDTEGFSAMAPPFYKKAARFVSELELGSLLTFTLHTDNGLLSFFMHDNICLSVRHTGRGFVPGVREKLEIVTRELARMYSTAKPGKEN